jgi:hypothetical protein
MRRLIASGFLTAFVLLPMAGADSTFEFHSGFWINLHHFLYEQATLDEQATVDTPPTPTSPAWQNALNYYRREVIKLDLMTDEAAQTNNQLSNLRLPNLEDKSSLHDSGLPADLIAVLESAAPDYREHWWPEHDHANRSWIAAVAQLVSKYGEALKKELAAAYQTDWPATAIRVDVTEYANWAGAYTTLRPTHITISSVNAGNQGDAALEMLFHEASHSIAGKIRAALTDEVKAQNKLFRRREFWHAVLFYTTGEIVRRHLDSYTPYGLKNGLYDRAWAGAPEVLDADWKPYLNGKLDLATAISRVVMDYGIPDQAAAR